MGTLHICLLKEEIRIISWLYSVSEKSDQSTNGITICLHNIYFKVIGEICMLYTFPTEGGVPLELTKGGVVGSEMGASIRVYGRLEGCSWRIVGAPPPGISWMFPWGCSLNCLGA